MSTADALFDVFSKKFNAVIREFTQNSADDRSWSILDLRQQEIMDSTVDNTKKAQAFDRVLWEIDRIHPRAHTYYCKALQKRLALTDKKNTDDMKRIAQDAHMHSRYADIMLYGQIIYTIYKLSKDKNHFPYRDTAKLFRKKQLAEEIKQGRKERLDDLEYIDYLLQDPNYDPVQKLNKIEDALEILSEERYFGPIQANRSKRLFCKDAAKICREELHDTDTEKRYLEKALHFQQREDKAELEWAKRHGKPYKKLQEQYMQKYRTDKVY